MRVHRDCGGRVEMGVLNPIVFSCERCGVIVWTAVTFERPESAELRPVAVTSDDAQQPLLSAAQ